MKVQSNRPAARSTASQQPARAAQQAPTKSTGWGPKTQTPAAQARALSAHLKSPAGAALAAKIVSTVAKKSELARDLNWEAGNIGTVKPLADGKFQVNVTLEVVKPNGKIEKNYFDAITDAKGKVLDVPQG